MRFLIDIWRLRITHPLEDILLHADDEKSAFRRILYSPEIAPLFAYVFKAFLITPVGQVFGSRSAPSFFSLASDIRADLATTGTLVENYPMQEMAMNIQLPAPPTETELVPAVQDGKNLPFTNSHQQLYYNATFVDDNGVCAVRDRMISALHQSLVSAYILFGWPDQDRRSRCIAPEKWDAMATFTVLFLGYRINSRTMQITWPLYKRKALYADILLALNNPTRVPPKVAASILGKVRAAGLIAPWGPYISFSFAESIKHATCRAFGPIRSFWSRGKVRFNQSVIAALKLLAESLELPEFSPVWSCYIGLLVPREAAHSALSDASYEGVGGWSPELQIQWRFT
jgi:hypothetical protein